MIPPSYTPATLRAVLPQQADGDMAFAFDTAIGPIRLRMTEAWVIDLVAGLTEMMAYQRRRTNIQSPISSGSPKEDGSPHDCHRQEAA